MTARSRIMPVAAASALAIVSVFGTASAEDEPALTEILKTPLASADEQELTVMRVDYPPGFSSPEHYHTGHLVLYVLEGTGGMEVDGKVRTAAAGEVLEELPERTMVMRNQSDSKWLRFVVFQVSPEGAPFIVLQE